MGPRPKGEGGKRTKRGGDGGAGGASARVRTQCHSSGNLSEMGHYELKAASSQLLHHRLRCETRRGEGGGDKTGAVLRGERDSGTSLEKARPADLIVNRGRQNTRVGAPCRAPRALVISARRGKRSHKTRPRMAQNG